MNWQVRTNRFPEWSDRVSMPSWHHLAQEDWGRKKRLPAREHGLAPVIGLGAIALVGVALGAALAKPKEPRHPADSAPGRTARRSRFGAFAAVGRSVTIKRPRADLFAFWRDFENLPKFMENIEAVRQVGEARYAWTIRAPFGRDVEIVTEIVQERPGELIAWRSVAGSDIETEGRVTFEDAPAGRGTIVSATIAYVPPSGELGRFVAKLFQREPGIQARRELKRFKMLMETGEIATAGIPHTR